MSVRASASLQLGVAGWLALTATTFAAPAAKPLIDAKASAAKLEVWRDDVGQYYVVPVFGAFPFGEVKRWVFFGDGKAMYQQRIIAVGTSPSDTYDWRIWAPRADAETYAAIETADHRLTLTCGIKDARPLTPLTADQAKAFFARATFAPPRWDRDAKFLARDDDGVYYFVDVRSQEVGGNGDRVFVGLKGAMREQVMTNVVSDSSGAIYATKGGTLKIITEGKSETARWIKGSKQVALTILPIDDNGAMIYRGLGVYGALGTVCDDR
jgi:hypothetical protein